MKRIKTCPKDLLDSQRKMQPSFLRSRLSLQKEWVGKTTAVINWASVLAHQGLNVLVYDCDPQCNASQTMIEMQVRRRFSHLTSEDQTLLAGQIAGRLLVPHSKDPIQNTKIFLANAEPNEASLADYRAGRTPCIVVFSQETDDDDENHELHAVLITAEEEKPESKKIGELGDLFEDERWDEIEEVGDLTEDEKSNLMASLVIAFQYDASNIDDEVMYEFIKQPVDFVKQDKIATYNGFSDGFIITEIDSGTEHAAWAILHRIHGENIDIPPEELENIPRLMELLIACDGRDFASIDLKTKDEISELLARSYSICNLVDGFKSDIMSKSPTRDMIEAFARRTAIFRHPIGKPGDPNQGSLNMVMGSYNLQLLLGQMFALSTKALNEKSTSVVAPYAGAIYAFNHYLRTIPEMHHFDVVLVDINLGTDCFNSSLSMSGDAIASVFNPEAYSDHAMTLTGHMIHR